MIEDYRAGLGVDRAAEEADRAAGRRVACPTLVLWSRSRRPRGIARGSAAVGGRGPTTCGGGGPIDSGHHMAEEAPTPSPPTLLDFL